MNKTICVFMVLIGSVLLSNDPICAQQTDFYYAGQWRDTHASVYKNKELLYTHLENNDRCDWVTCMAISENGDVYYGGNGAGHGERSYVWKNGELLVSIEERSIIKGMCYNELEDAIYSVGYIHYDELSQRKGAIWRNNVLWDTIGTSLCYLNDIDFLDGHCYLLGTDHMVNGSGDLTIWKDGELLYVLGNSSELRGLRTLICQNGHVYACGIVREGNNHIGRIWKDGEVLYDYGAYAYVVDFCIDGEDIYACGEINIENQEQKGVVWKNSEVLYEYDYGCFINPYTILKVGDDLYFGGAGYYFGKHPKEMSDSSYGVLFKNGETLDIDPECSVIYALSVSNESTALEIIDNTSFSVFPNPANTWATIDYKLPLGATEAQMRIVNTLGVTVATYNLQGTETQKVLDLRDMPPGLYTYMIYYGNNLQIRKLIIVE